MIPFILHPGKQEQAHHDHHLHLSFSLVIPAYNEENRIQLLFDEIAAFDGELIVVCDGTDGTAECCQQDRGHADGSQRSAVLSSITGSGKGAV
ncbi:MAG: hypothetical protein MZV70_30660 [Desulfobacterales bacterium]|nr:hypothetical protein [Desulfobacterales bacterium]